MRLSVVFELLLVFLFLAFAAARVIDQPKGIKNVAKGNKKVTTLRQGPPNRYCACTSRMCNCCRDFSLPVVPIKGPGCASIMYVQRDTMMVTMSFGDRVLSNTTISGKTPKPICMALPGGISQFCGRVYGISRKGDQFRACLGLELRALDDIEAALRVSCFKFGPKGVKLESAPPVPSDPNEKDPEDEDEEDYDLDDDEEDDLIGFGVDDEDDGTSSEDNEVDSDSVDYTGFSVLGEDLLGTLFSDDSGSSSAKKKKPTKKTAKPQVVVPKISTTTRRPILPTRRRTTAKPLLSVTKRPLVNRVTKKPALSVRPQVIQRPSIPVIVTPQAVQSIHPVSPTVVTKIEVDKNIITKSPAKTTQAPVTTTKIITTMQSQESEKLSTTGEEFSQETTVVTEEPITFTIPTQRTEVVKNDIKLPQTDLAKLEAVAAIAQQDVTSGVISSSSYEETQTPIEVVTMKYEKITPTYETETTPFFENTEKISSIKFVPTTVVTSRPSAELADDSLDETTESELVTNSQPQLVGMKNKIIYQKITTTNLSDNNNGNIVNSIKEIVSGSELATKKGNFTVTYKKQPVKKPQKEENEEEEEEEEGEEDLLEGVLSDDDDNTENEEAENNEEETQSQVSTNKVKNEEEEEDDDDDDDDEEEEEEEEEDSIGETVQTSQKLKPTKVSIKKKPASDESEDEEEEEEEDILDVLGDDDEEEESDDDDVKEDEKPEINKNKKKTTTQATTVKVKKPTTQKIVQTRKPTERVPISTTPEEKITEKIIIYKQPVDQNTENVVIYQEPQNPTPTKIFIYKDPENPMTQKTTEKIIFYKEPTEQMHTEKFVIYKEPEEKITEKPAVVMNGSSNKSSEETKDDSEEDENESKIENDDDSEEESEDDELEKHTLMASIVKPGFSNKYAEEHDLTENDDLDIEDPEDNGTDYEEDRKMKETHKKPAAKPPPEKKTQVHVSKPKVLTLSDLIGQRKQFYDHSKDDKPISTSRTHRRMNLDRFLQA